jgi:nucleotide-binding universal stress UspA family protein
MSRDLREVVNKIIVPVSEDDPTADDVAGLASDLAAFFDASVVLVYMGRLPLSIPLGPNQAGSPQVAAAVLNSIEANGNAALDRMAEMLTSHGVPVSSRIVVSYGNHIIRDIIEKEQADLVVLPKWEAGVTSRLARVLSPSILEDATCPVLVLKGNKWLTKSKAARPGISPGRT